VFNSFAFIPSISRSCKALHCFDNLACNCHFFAIAPIARWI
jgi:hypothetical protein